MLTLLLLCSMCADPMPLAEPLREYFRRCDENRDAAVTKLTEMIEDTNIDLRNAPKERHPALKKRLAQLNDALATAKESTPVSHFPPRTTKNEVGCLPSTVVARVIDDTTVILQRRSGGGGPTWFVIADTNTKDMSPGDKFVTAGLWRVVDTELTNQTIIRNLRNIRGDERDAVVITRIPAAEFASAAAAYDAEKAANGGRPLPRPATANPAADPSLDAFLEGVRANERNRESKRFPIDPKRGK